MKINEKLRALRLAQKLTQEDVAVYLGVTSQSVSKWERGILSPDIYILPKIAILYKTSIDAIFDMEFYWSEQHEADFRSKVRFLLKKGDSAGVWDAYMTEINLRPDQFDFYTDIMLYSLRTKLLDEEHLSRLIRLADYADGHCHDDDRRNEIHRLMVQICGSSNHEGHKAMAMKYYAQLPMLRHSREVYARFVMSGDAYQNQLKENILYSVDIAECAARQMITPDMSDDAKLYVYQRAAALYEAVLDDRFGGFYDIPLLCDYAKIVILLSDMGRGDEADFYMEKMLDMLQKFRSPKEQTPTSVFVGELFPENHTSPYINGIKLIRDVIDKEAFARRREDFSKILQSFEKML